MPLLDSVTDLPQDITLKDEGLSHTIQPTMEINGTKTSNAILDIVFDYALNKFDDSVDRLSAGRPNFLTIIDQFVIAGKQVKMCLPAFPFKSANKVEKVFGTLPDKAEELALERLNSMCKRIGDVYPPGAKVTIISDGLTYNGKSSTSRNDYTAFEILANIICSYR